MHLPSRIWLAPALCALILAGCGKETPPTSTDGAVTPADTSPGGVATAPDKPKPRTAPTPAPERAEPICTTHGNDTACVCRSGFVLGADGKSCDDVDECATDNGGCAGTCTNTPGAYACACPDGQDLGLDGRLCYDPTPVPEGSMVSGGATREELDAAFAAWAPELPPQVNDTTAASGLVVVDDATRNDVKVGTSELRFPVATHKDVLTWEKGKVLVSAPSDPGAAGKNPFGFARKVERVETVGDEIVVTTRAAALEEIIHGEFQLTFDLDKARDVSWENFAENAEWAAATLYTNSLPDPEFFSGAALRDDARAGGDPEGALEGDPMFGWLKKKASNLASKVGGAVATIANRTKNTVAAGANAAKSGIVKVAQTAGSAVAKGAAATGSAIAAGAKATGSAIAAGAEATGKAVVTAGTAVGSAARAVGGFVVGTGKSAAAKAAGTVSSIGNAIAETAGAIYRKVMPQSFKGSMTFDPEFKFDAIDLSIVKYEVKKTFKGGKLAKYPIEAEFSADGNVKAEIAFKPSLSLGAEIPNPIAAGETPPLRVWLDVGAALSAKLTADLALEAAIASAGGEAGSKLEEDLGKASDFAENVLNGFRKEVLGNEDTKPVGHWKKTLYLSQPKTITFMLGQVPVVLTATFQVDVQCGFEAKAQLNAEATLESTHTFKLHAEYQQGKGVLPVHPDYEPVNRFEIQVTGGGEAVVSCGVIPRVNTFLYDTIGLNAGIRGSLIAEAKYESTCAATSKWPDGKVSLGLSAGIGFPVGARIQTPGSSWGGKDAQDLGIDIGPIEVWNTKIPIIERKFDVPGLGYCTPTCENGRKGDDEPETDVDCGGDCARGCAEGKGCSANSDCETGLYCLSGACSTSTCGDGVLSGTETDVDCGGTLCAPCKAERTCLRDDDCASGACTKGTVGTTSMKMPYGVCADDPCQDGTRSPGECGVDCGGSCSQLCADGAICGDASQCASGQSNGYQCTTSCHNLKMDGQETDLDCGGPGACDRCSPGKRCKEASDCAGDSDCQGGLCTTVEAPCGGFGQECCAGGACDAGLGCNNDLCACGPDNGVQCGGTCCAAGQHCVKDACVDPAPTCLAFPTEKRATCTSGACPATCLAQKKRDSWSESGIYMVQPDPSRPPLEVLCDMERDGGGWTLVGFEAAGQPVNNGDGVMASLWEETGAPADIASGAASGFIGPRFSFARGQYKQARLNWCDPAVAEKKNLYEIFETTDELFADGARTGTNTIALHGFQSNDPVLNQQIPNPDGARFCRARTSALRPGDTSWGVKGANESNFICGCNSGGWTGVGSYYGGTSAGCTVCDCHGGGWSGTAGNHVPKANVNRHTTHFWIR